MLQVLGVVGLSLPNLGDHTSRLGMLELWLML